MPIESNLNVQPYYDDFDKAKQYYKMLFKPSVAVQVRELNQLQSILQNQIERFGDNVFKRGTIISGVNFSFNANLPYVKLKDTETDSLSYFPSSLVGLFAMEPSTNLISHVLYSSDGFEATDPDLKTIYVKYINSGTSGNTVSYSAGQSLTFYANTYSLGKYDINNGSSGFSNTDLAVFVSAIALNVSSSNAFSNAEIINSSDGAKAQVIGIDQNTMPGYTILKLKPTLADITAYASANTPWVFSSNTTVTGNTSLAVGSIYSVLGAGAQGMIVTDGIGKVVSFSYTNHGAGYIVEPFLTIKQTKSTGGNYTDIDITPHNYWHKVTVSSVANSVGYGYGMSISSGVIYQKGYFLEVNPQTVIVTKYDQPNNVSVVFNTRESIIDYNIDTTLLDPIIDTNTNAPGADRLKMEPVLTVMDTTNAVSNDQVFSLVSFSGGQPFRQNKSTQYSVINDEMAKRTDDASGNYVLDPFDVTTKFTVNNALQANTMTVVVDPGSGYISGYRTTTASNYYQDIPKGVDTLSKSNFYLSMAYDNYVRVTEVGGVFQFNTGDLVTLYNTAATYITSGTVDTSVITPAGSAIGTARIRSMVLESGTPGTGTAVYRLYIFALNMTTGYNLASVKSVYYNGSYPGIADVVLEYDASTNTNIATAHGRNSTLVFDSQLNTIQNATAVNYQYRTINQSVSLANNGTAAISYSSIPNEFFPYSGNLSSSQLQDLYVVPVGNSLISSTTLAGTVVANATSANVVGAGTSFVTTLQAGDYVYVSSNSTAFSTRRVISVVNNTFFSVDSNLSFSNTSCTVQRCFPKFAPVPFGSRSGLSANVNGPGNILTLNFGMTFTTTSTTNVAVAYNILRTGVTPGAKIASRNQFVKLSMANNAASNSGPWCLGVPDIFRLRSVHVFSNSSVNAASTNVSDYFFIDSNQNSDFYDLGFLYSDPKQKYRPSATDWLLVEFDCFTTTSNGFFNSTSYLTSNTSQLYAHDALDLTDLSTNINSFEVPEFYDNSGNCFDLLKCFDFRPFANSTITPASNAALALVNPVYSTTFGNTTNIANDKKFPLPSSIFTANVSYFVGRTDLITLDKNSNFNVISGIPGTNQSPTTPDDSILLAKVIIPSYPTLETYKSANTVEILNNRMISERLVTKRISAKTVKVDTSVSPQYRRYTMSDIAKLDRRLKVVEYQASLSLLESNLQNKVIPSSIAPNVNRFKYGFFIDDVTSMIFSDINSIEYSAAPVVTEKVIYPAMEWITVKGTFNVSTSDTWEELTLVNQLTATIPPTVNTVVTTTSNVVTNNFTTVTTTTLVTTIDTTYNGDGARNDNAQGGYWWNGPGYVYLWSGEADLAPWAQDAVAAAGGVMGFDTYHSEDGTDNYDTQYASEAFGSYLKVNGGVASTGAFAARG